MKANHQLWKRLKPLAYGIVVLWCCGVCSSTSRRGDRSPIFRRLDHRFDIRPCFSLMKSAGQKTSINPVTSQMAADGMLLVALHVEVENEDSLQAGDDDRLHPFVFRVRQVGVPGLRTLEAHNESVSEPVVQSFRRIIGTMLHVQ